ncbi:lipopolysaccharide biosynthesis protein [Arthrobacter sp. Soil764]|uniref:lipopolysaccharide biosynthesis protein n=1 Tax=Arthrobacter sp. Soil764 TaxID=1736403 RepID=UPI000A8F9AA4|nr:hypothetical protein [Arthrobacter sp. Soil764]
MKKALDLLGKVFVHQTVVAQILSALSAIIAIVILSRWMPSQDYAHYAVVTAIWAIGNAVVGTATGTRIARTAAEGAHKISFRLSELLIASVVSILCGGYVVILRASYIDGVLAAASMMTFVLAEASISFEIGAARFKRYLFLLIIRVVSPIIVLMSGILFDILSLTWAFMAVLLGNVLSIVPSLWRWSARRYTGVSYSSHMVGSLNFGLWVMASADRIILEPLVDPTDLALYALTYGLMDRFFRALSNAYITRSLGASFSGAHTIPDVKYFLVTLLLYFGVVLGAGWAVEIVSGGRYSPSILLSLLIAGAGLAMLWSAPFYVALLAGAQYKGSLIIVGLIAVFNITFNASLDGYFGILGAASISLGSYIMWLVWLALRTRRMMSASD